MYSPLVIIIFGCNSSTSYHSQARICTFNYSSSSSLSSSSISSSYAPTYDQRTEQEFNSIPTLELVAGADNADALRRQLILSPALPVAPTPDNQIRSHLQIQTYYYLTRSSLRLPIPTMKSEALTTR